MEACPTQAISGDGYELDARARPGARSRIQARLSFLLSEIERRAQFFHGLGSTLDNCRLTP